MRYLWRPDHGYHSGLVVQVTSKDTNWMDRLHIITYVRPHFQLPSSFSVHFYPGQGVRGFGCLLCTFAPDQEQTSARPAAHDMQCWWGICCEDWMFLQGVCLLSVVTLLGYGCVPNPRGVGNARDRRIVFAIWLVLRFSIPRFAIPRAGALPPRWASFTS